MKKLKSLLTSLLLIFFSVFIPNTLVSNSAKNKLFDNEHVIPKNKVGLVLGTSKYLSDGRINLYYQYRIEAAISLYKAGKIEFLLISGDNSVEGYDEPTDIKNDLIKNGIPEEIIFLDYAGFRTLDSIIRAKDIFGQSEFTIISQKFHNERALYLASHNNINAIAFNAKEITGSYGFKTNIREYLARTKACMDLIFNVKPKFFGEKIIIK